MESTLRLAVFTAADSPASAQHVLEEVLQASEVALTTLPDAVEAPSGLTAAAARVTADAQGVEALRTAVRSVRDVPAAVLLAPQSLLDAERMLLVTDVDSTLIEQEVIELLAAHAGREAEVAAVTERAMRGELDFAQSLHHRVEALTGLPVGVMQEVAARITPTAGAEALIRAAHRAGHKVGAVSGGFIQVLEPLAERLGLDHARANVLGVADAALTGSVVGDVVDRAAKQAALVSWAEAEGVPLSATIGMGDGANDLDLVDASALGVGVQPKPALRARVDATLDLRRLDTVAATLGWPLD
ncbi:MAG: phosphoserine phosphatase SerB [Galactobacter sp.]|uniref:phosphoserine phosphatase SerB n=1 Tax=Galactobacter sp. TaxID=2676125 RepID=UPI0025C00E9A|nr:phosphoserine phosphatase SerB [Galactobacter sp.]